MLGFFNALIFCHTERSEVSTKQKADFERRLLNTESCLFATKETLKHKGFFLVILSLAKARRRIHKNTENGLTLPFVVDEPTLRK